MQVLNSRGGVVRDLPVSAFDPATGQWDAADEPVDDVPHGERVLLEDVAAELGQALDEVTAQITAQRPGLIVLDWGGRPWVPARILENVRKANRARLAAAARPADREGDADA